MNTVKFDQNRVTEVLDITLLNNFIRKIYLFTKIPITLLDLKGDVIVASEWTTLCSQFMRNGGSTALNCLAVCSDIGSFDKGIFRCPNGLYMHRVPIRIGEQPVAYLVISQFLLANSENKDHLANITSQWDGNEEFLNALQQIPKVTDEEIKDVIELFNEFVVLVHNMIERKMKTNLLEEEIMQSYEELEASYLDISSLNDQMTLLNLELHDINLALTTSEKRYRVLNEKMRQGIIVLNESTDFEKNTMEYVVSYMNPALKNMRDFESIVNYSQSHVKEILDNKQKLMFQLNQKYYEIEYTRLTLSEVMVCVSDVSDVYEQLNFKQDQMWRLVESMGKLVEKRDLYTADHQKQVAILAVRMAIEMGLNQQQIESVYVASLLHDIGKISIPAEILTKPAQLTDIEYALIKTHVNNAYDILNKINFTLPITNIVMQHHERLDGTGYPNGLVENAICIEAKIVAVADVYEAIISHRPYRPSLGETFAQAHLYEGAGKIYDKTSVDACIKVSGLPEWQNDDVVRYLKLNNSKSMHFISEENPTYENTL